MIDREMRTLIRAFKKTQPLGIRARTQQQMREAYELADEEGRAMMKESIRAALNGEPDPSVARRENEQVAVPIVNYCPTNSLLEQGSEHASGSSDSGPQETDSGDGV